METNRMEDKAHGHSEMSDSLVVSRRGVASQRSLHLILAIMSQGSVDTVGTQAEQPSPFWHKSPTGLYMSKV